MSVFNGIFLSLTLGSVTAFRRFAFGILLQHWSLVLRASALVLLCCAPIVGLDSVSAQQPDIDKSCYVDPSPATASTQIEDRDMFCDSLGLIVHKDADGSFNGGDTAQREGWYWLGVWIRNHTPGMPHWNRTRRLSFEQVLKLLEPGNNGVFYRHPTQEPYNHPFDKEWGFSRDQMVPLVAAMGVWNKQAELNRLWAALPEDALAKHAFNGNWRNFLGQDGPNCGDILKRGCDSTSSCPLEVDKRSCPLKIDNRSCPTQTDDRNCSLEVDSRDCSLNVDRTDCSLQQDTTSCGHDVDWGLLGKHHVNDPVCEAAKVGQNAGYLLAKNACEARKAAKNADYLRENKMCEIAKGGQNTLYATQKFACETSKSTQQALYDSQKLTCETSKANQNTLYATQKFTCEAGKTGQNAIYATRKASCESAKTAKKYACEVDKQIGYQTCRTTNTFSGDIIGPSDVNLFRRAFRVSPVGIVNKANSLTLIQGGLGGEAELLVNSHIRVEKSSDPDDVGDDLNHIVRLLMSRVRSPTGISEIAVGVYAKRQPSYGSYLDIYYRTNSGDKKIDVDKIKAGIWAGWIPDSSASYGAVRWYHRPDVGANPQLAILYRPIIERFIR